jgi:hypothetical protein
MGMLGWGPTVPDVEVLEDSVGALEGGGKGHFVARWSSWGLGARRLKRMM